MEGLTRRIEDHLHTQRSQLSTGTTICYALDSHYFRAKLAGKSISWCQVYQTSMQSASVERGERGAGRITVIQRTNGGRTPPHIPHSKPDSKHVEAQQPLISYISLK